jgi:hypothetical protein
MSKSLAVAIVVGLLVSFGTQANADDLQAPPVLNERTEADYYQPQVPPRYEPDTRAIVRQKAMLRAEQRTARLESRRWHERSSSRPTIVASAWGSPYGAVSFPVPSGNYRYSRPPFMSVAVSTGLDSGPVRADAGRTAAHSVQDVR